MTLTIVILTALVVALLYRMEWLRAERDDYLIASIARSGRIVALGAQVDLAAGIIRDQRTHIEQLEWSRDNACIASTAARAKLAFTHRVIAEAEAAVDETHALLASHMVEVAP